MEKHINAYRLKARLVQEVVTINPTWGDTKQAWQEGYNNALMSVCDRLDDLPAADVATRWIPVTERLPEDDEMKLVTAQPKNGAANVNRAYFDGQFWHGSGSMSNVIAWMPMPEPYKDKE